MSELGNVKAGERVLKGVELRYGWGQNIVFWIPKNVKRVTKTLIILEEDEERFKKNGNSCIRPERYSRAYWAQIIPYSASKSEVIEYLMFKEKIKSMNKITDLIARLGSFSISNTYSNKNDDTSDLNKIINKLNEINSILESRKEE